FRKLRGGYPEPMNTDPPVWMSSALAVCAPRNDTSVIALALAHLAAKDPIDKHHIDEDQRQERRGPEQHEDLARRMRSGLPDRERRRHQIREARDHEAQVAEQEQRDRGDERQQPAPGFERAPCRESADAAEERHRP